MRKGGKNTRIISSSVTLNELIETHEHQQLHLQVQEKYFDSENLYTEVRLSCTNIGKRQYHMHIEHILQWSAMEVIISEMTGITRRDVKKKT